MRLVVYATLASLILSTALHAQDGQLDPEQFMPDSEPETGEMLTPDADVVAPQADDVPVRAVGQARVDKLFDDLRKASNSAYANTLAEAIWAHWFRSGSATTDLMMSWATAATQRGDFHIALDYLDQVVTRDPTYAEGWNRRATVHFMMNNLAKSMSDINRVLELEPRHFGALSGMAMILERTGRKQAARDAWAKTLEVYPALQSAQQGLIRLEEDLAGERT